jgi:predicted Zn-dependent protease
VLAPATRTRRASSRLVAIALLLSLVLFIGGGCTLSEKEELDVGRKTHAQIEKQFGGKVEDPAMQQYVNSVGMEMARRADRPNMDWQFAVLKSDQINAFAVPGGYVYITRGLLAKMQNEAQLAGVLGHEAAHIAKRHSAKLVGNQRVTQGLSIGA